MAVAPPGVTEQYDSSFTETKYGASTSNVSRKEGQSNMFDHVPMPFSFNRGPLDGGCGSATGVPCGWWTVIPETRGRTHLILA